MFNLRYVFVFLALFASINLSAKDQVYTIGEPYGIIADDKEWACNVTHKDEIFIDNDLYGNLYIHGQSKKIDHLSFDFFYTKSNSDKIGAIKFNILNNYANLTDTFLFNTRLLEPDINFHHNKIIIEGDFIDNISTGYFQVESIRSGGNKWFTVFSKVRLDYQDRDSLQQLFDSIYMLRRHLCAC